MLSRQEIHAPYRCLPEKKYQQNGIKSMRLNLKSLRDGTYQRMKRGRYAVRWNGSTAAQQLVEESLTRYAHGAGEDGDDNGGTGEGSLAVEHRAGTGRPPESPERKGFEMGLGLG